MSLKEKIGITVFGLIMVGLNMFLFEYAYPSTARYVTAFICVGVIVITWVNKEIIRGKVRCIELWKIKNKGEDKQLIAEFDESSKEALRQLFHVYCERLPDEGVEYDKYAIRVYQRKKDFMIYPDKKINSISFCVVSINIKVSN